MKLQWWIVNSPTCNAEYFDLAQDSLTAGVTGKGGICREKPPDAKSAVGAASLKAWAKSRTCPVHAVLGGNAGIGELFRWTCLILTRSEIAFDS